MKDRSVIVIHDASGTMLLLTLRGRDPYRGLYDFIGGSSESGEDAMSCAYRVLAEKTGLPKGDIPLEHIMDFAYQTTQACVQVFYGKLAQAFPLSQEETRLAWMDIHDDFFDPLRYAGEGYMGHILSHLQMQLADSGE